MKGITIKSNVIMDNEPKFNNQYFLDVFMIVASEVISMTYSFTESELA